MGVWHNGSNISIEYRVRTEDEKVMTVYSDSFKFSVKGKHNKKIFVRFLDMWDGPHFKYATHTIFEDLTKDNVPFSIKDLSDTLQNEIEKSQAKLIEELSNLQEALTLYSIFVKFLMGEK